MNLRCVHVVCSQNLIFLTGTNYNVSEDDFKSQVVTNFLKQRKRIFKQKIWQRMQLLFSTDCFHKEMRQALKCNVVLFFNAIIVRG